MSGIVGLVNLDGAPVDRHLLGRMTEFMEFRGPDAQRVWVNGHVGFGHTLLRTTDEAAREAQPFSLDGETWIVADARVDGREELIARLRAEGREIQPGAPDCELILHAYHAWGEGCVERLIGDFAFAVWDGRERRLFCARDHFGVRPFYYARVGSTLIFGNTLNCVRLHPAVSDELNELYIGDFLLFGYSQEVATTVFVDILRLPPAHCLSLSRDYLRLHQYWALPNEVVLRDQRRARDVLDEFGHHLRAAVEDRLRTNCVGVLMSGGLDSTSVAAVAHQALAKKYENFELRAYCGVYDYLIPDEERHYAGLAAESIGIPIDFLPLDNFSPYEHWKQTNFRRPEPFHNPLFVVKVELWRRLAERSRVSLSGWDGDAVMCELLKPYFTTLFRERRFGRLARDCWSYMRWKGEPPPVGVRTWLRQQWRRVPESRPTLPTWLNRDFAARLDLAGRWEEWQRKPRPAHDIRPNLYSLFRSSLWTGLFEEYDCEVTLRPVEFRHPLADLRLVNFLLSVPPAPWLVGKEILRAAMRGVLPERIRQRPKSPVRQDAVTKLVCAGRCPGIDKFTPTPQLKEYVTPEAIPDLKVEDIWQVWINLRPLSLNHWLQHAVQPLPEPQIGEYNV
jgi:asparagine synthase (glutamine-hydrolysing)